MSSRWRRTSPQELAGWLAGIDVSWAFAGGWALDLWLGEVTREHSDIEIACFQADLSRLISPLFDFEIALARNKQLTPYSPGDALPPPPFSLWLRRHGETIWDFEIVSESQEGGAWAYRREPSIRHPLDTTFLTSRGGLPIVAPEIQLLYKAKNPRPKDLEDLGRVVPRLDEGARVWLRAAIAAAHPESLAIVEDILAQRAPKPW